MSDDQNSANDPQSEAATRRAALELDSKTDYAQYMLKSKGEMFSVFKGLVDHVAQISMIFNEGHDMVLTSLISYGDKGLVLDYGASPEMNRKAVDASKLFCVTQLDKVKVQFILTGVNKIEHSGRPAFSASLPESVLRLQRREYYRLPTPIVRPLQCVFPYKLPDGGLVQLKVNVADISGGGIGLIGIPDKTPMEVDMEFNGVKLDLPEIGLATFNLVVRNAFEVDVRGGSAKAKRAGYEFVKIPGNVLTLIQRYIIKMERERKARE
jgi:c-di-GMP-binding flagellar brake protein YcgR